MWRVMEEGERDASYNNSSLFIFLIKKTKRRVRQIESMWTACFCLSLKCLND